MAATRVKQSRNEKWESINHVSEGTPSTSCLCRESYYAQCSYFEETHLCCLLRLDKDDTDLGMVENELNSVLTCNSADGLCFTQASLQE